MTGQSPPPDVTVVIPARNAASTIAEQLKALSLQTFSGTWEVLVVVNATTDDTTEVASSWADSLPLRVLQSPVASLARAKNLGTNEARSPLVAYCDSDDVVSPTWLSAMASALSESHLATGPIDLARLNPHRLYGWRGPRWQQLPRWLGYLRPVMGCNMGVSREAFQSVGGFDETLRHGGEDFDFAWRLQLAGFSLGFAPEAIVHWRMRPGIPYLRQSMRYGECDVALYLRFRDHGMPRRPILGAARLLGALFGAPILLVPRYRYAWMGLAGAEIGRLRGSLKAKTLFL